MTTPNPVTAPNPDPLAVPLRFIPRFVEKIWGGRRLETVLNKPIPPGEIIGESWELYDFPPGGATTTGDDAGTWTSATVADGPLAGRTIHDLLIDAAIGPRRLLGRINPVDTPHGPQFPLLVKFLDARDDLSVQVHPRPEYAADHPDAFVKNEAWHVIHAERSADGSAARVLRGWREPVTADRVRRALLDGTVVSLLHADAASESDTFYLPSGTVHALGGGLLVAEVQTPSDTTYRVYDFDRIDPSAGGKRTLHVDRALACCDFTPADPSHAVPDGGGSTPRTVADAPQFRIRRHAAAGPAAGMSDEAVVLIVTRGTVTFGDTIPPADAGQTLLLPPGVTLTPAPVTHDAQWLEVRFG